MNNGVEIVIVEDDPEIRSLLVFALGHRISNDAATRLDVGAPALRYERAQRDAGIEVARIIEVEDGAGVHAAPGRFEFVVELLPSSPSRL